MTLEGKEFSNNLTQTRAELVNQRVLRNANLINEFISSDVYKELISLDIDDMVSSCGAYVKDGFWNPGAINSRVTSASDLRYYAGYQAGLIELSRMWRDYIKLGERALKKANEKDTNPTYTNPMLDELSEEETDGNY